jgi:hypothetical protein
MYEYEFSVKWLELLIQIAPGVKRVAVLHDPGPIGINQHAAVAAQAPKLKIAVTSIEIRSADETRRAIEAFAMEGDGGGLPGPSDDTGRQHVSPVPEPDLGKRLPCRLRSRDVQSEAVQHTAHGLDPSVERESPPGLSRPRRAQA